MQSTRTLQVMLLLVSLLPSSVLAQKGGGQSGGPASPPASASLQGLSYEQSSWRDRLKLPPLKQKERAVLCYRLGYGNDASQPFLLTPVLPDPNPKTLSNNQPDDWQDFYQTSPPGKIADPEERKWFSNPKHKEVPWTPCVNVGAKRPLKMNQTLVVAIDAKAIDLTRVRILNFNITNQQGTPINPTPIRPSFNNSGTGATQGGGGLASDRNPNAALPYFFTWPNLLPGDVLPTVSVNAVYTPPVPGEAWTKQTFYPLGSVVTPSTRSGHYYLALHGGISGATEPTFPISTPPAIEDGQILWVDSGPTVAASGSNAKAPGIWIPHHAYSQGDAIVDPYNGHTYVSLTPTAASPGSPSPTSDALPSDPFSLPTLAPPVQVSDSAALSWKWDGSATAGGCTALWAANHPYKAGDPIGPYGGHCYIAAISTGAATVNSSAGPDPIAQAIPAQTAPAPAEVHEGSMTWDWDHLSTVTACNDASHAWKAGQSYPVGAIVGHYNGRCYKSTAPGTSGLAPVQPYFPVGQTLTVNDPTPAAGGTNAMQLVWQDVGTIAPAAVTSASPTDQTVSLVYLQLPQVHSLSYFNLSAGVVYSTVRSHTFGVPPGQSGQISTNQEIVISNTVTVDPLLLLTVYPWPIDAETNCGFKCLWKTYPGASIGFSLASPTTSFYAGTSLEVFRNVQLVLAANFAKESTLPNPAVQIPASTTTAVTSQRFSTGFAVGLTFNVSGFVQSLFGGGGSKGSGNGS